MRRDVMGRLLVVDDDPNFSTLIRSVALTQGFEVRTVNQAREFKSAYGEFAPNVIVLDLVMPDMDGIEVLEYLGGCACGAGIILLSGTDATCLRMAGEIGSMHGLSIMGALQKPFRIAELRQLLAGAIPA